MYYTIKEYSQYSIVVINGRQPFLKKKKGTQEPT